MDSNYKVTASILKALADETRLQIIDMLKDGELCACKILENFDITQPTLSYHMKILTDCGLVDGRRDGAWMRYTLKIEAFESIGSQFEDICDSINLSQSESAAKRVKEASPW